ncbi:flagellar biosynthesis protein FliQ [Caldithrix abyssi]|uniref:Flagellar biosynthetic protein FliQ n=1 Tax=Caldithrix abyssi DSM 13497 TaxID=880073 RepID=H1XQ09_CALAY|nr:flagellar biosynthesis protein FliQ [Caldithrix abyssi]APF18235.1 flagellar biosynthetic protein FliQ [Caldithrix abyssi DSM 13497]EHO42260.1 flagellar biosynthetic protein FliQ [Caldithrix abyssi DSM 13497]
MTTDFVLYISRQALTTAFYILLPVLGVGMLIGLVVGVFQAATQINEMTLAFVPKIIVMFLVIFLLLPWFLNLLMDFTVEIFNYMVLVSQ